MSLKDTLAYLFPISLGGVHQVDLEHDARMLEVAQARCQALLSEIFADTSYELLLDWERVYDITPGADDPLQSRRDRVVRKIRTCGGLSRAYFIELASSMGYTVEIEEPIPSMACWLCAGDELMSAEVIYQWGVKGIKQSLYYFRSGGSSSGDALLWWQSINELEQLLQLLRPSHTDVYFVYEEE